MRVSGYASEVGIDAVTLPTLPDGPGPGSTAEVLSAVEHRAMELTKELTDVLRRIVGHGPTRTADLRELTTHVHAIQQAILSQAAARAYPDRYRLLGEEIT